MTWLDTNQAAALINRSVVQTRRWAEQGVLPAYKSRGRWRFDAAELNAWVRNDNPTKTHRSITTRPRPAASRRS